MQKISVGGLCLLILFLANVESVPGKTYNAGVSMAPETRHNGKPDRGIRGLAGEKIIIGGTGDSQELLRSLASAFEKSPGGGAIEVPDSIGSGGGIKALIAGKIDLARVARPLKEGEEKLGLVYLSFAMNPVVFVIHPGLTGIDSITTEQIIGI